VGEELRCSARGNPVPEMTLGPSNVVKETASGPGWRSVVVKPEWIGRTLTLQCSSRNTVDEQEFNSQKSVTFNVTGKPLIIII